MLFRSPVSAQAPGVKSAEEICDAMEAATSVATSSPIPRWLTRRSSFPPLHVELPKDRSSAIRSLSQIGYVYRRPTLKDAVQFYLGAAAG